MCEEQKMATMAMLSCSTDVLVAIKTGGGKSMAPIITSILIPAETIVIAVPLKSLMVDWKRRLDEMAVPYMEFCVAKGKKISAAHNLILASTDILHRSEWKQAIVEAHQQRPVKRICFDEGQLTFTDNDYRSALNDMYQIRALFPVQFTVLSATIPEIAVPSLQQNFGLLANTLIIRTSSSRSEIRYMLEKKRSKSGNLTRISILIQTEMEQFRLQDRGLIFVNYLEDGEELAKRLDFEFYHGGKTLSDEQRHSIVKRFFMGEKKFMICTSAYGAGNDYRHIRTCIHFGNPRHMIGYIQESGRVGRDGYQGNAYVLRQITTQSAPDIRGHDDVRGEIVMYNWMHGAGDKMCSRFMVTSFCDSKGTLCSDDPRAKECGVCEVAPQSSSALPPPQTSSKRLYEAYNSEITTFRDAMESAKRRCLEKELREQDYLTSVVAALDSFSLTCSFCSLLGIRHYKHAITDCTKMKEKFYGSEGISFYRKQIRYGENQKVCFWCHVPQRHDRLHNPFTGVQNASRCRYRDVAFPAVAAIYVSKKSSLQHYFGQEWTDWKDFANWLSKKPSDSIHDTNLISTLLWYHALSLAS